MVSDDDSVPEKSAISQWGKFFENGGKTMGRSFLVVHEGTQRKAMEEAGFVDIQEWEFKVCLLPLALIPCYSLPVSTRSRLLTPVLQAPVGSWPKDARLKEIGIWGQTALEADIEGYVLFIANVIAGWTREEILVYIAHLRREIRSAKYHPYFKVKAVWGRKPEHA